MKISLKESLLAWLCKAKVINLHTISTDGLMKRNLFGMKPNTVRNTHDNSPISYKSLSLKFRHKINV